MKCPILQNQNDPLLQTLNKPFSNGLYCEIRKKARMDSNRFPGCETRGAERQLMERRFTISLYSMLVSQGWPK